MAPRVASPASGRRRPWYTDGVRFACTGCARCCYNRDDYQAVWVERQEVRLLARHLRLTVRETRRRYLERLEEGWSLRSRGTACVFLDAATRRCRVYDARPRQCRTWPFWPENLRRDTWDREVAPFCPGVGQGRRYSAGEIRALARATDPALPLPALPAAGEGPTQLSSPPAERRRRARSLR